MIDLDMFCCLSDLYVRLPGISKIERERVRAIRERRRNDYCFSCNNSIQIDSKAIYMYI